MLPVQRGYRLNPDDVLRREVINGLMCDGRVDFPQIEATHGVRFNDYFAEALLQLDEQVADGLLLIQADALQLLPKGQLMVRSVAMAFDAYLGGAHKGQFSRTV
jgi:oxygen-independent coproporphyrinogen-3 oxidase